MESFKPRERAFETGKFDGPCTCASGARNLLEAIALRARKDGKFFDFECYWVNRRPMRRAWELLGEHVTILGRTRNAAKSGGMI